jgi:hypothetical protein
MSWTYPISTSVPTLNVPLAFDGTNIVGMPLGPQVIARGTQSIDYNLAVGGTQTVTVSLPAMLSTDVPLWAFQTFSGGFGTIMVGASVLLAGGQFDFLLANISSLVQTGNITLVWLVIR